MIPSSGIGKLSGMMRKSCFLPKYSMYTSSVVWCLSFSITKALVNFKRLSVFFSNSLSIKSIAAPPSTNNLYPLPFLHPCLDWSLPDIADILLNHCSSSVCPLLPLCHFGKVYRHFPCFVCFISVAVVIWGAAPVKNYDIDSLFFFSAQGRKKECIYARFVRLGQSITFQTEDSPVSSPGNDS